MSDPRGEIADLAWYYGARVADTPVCEGHHAPLDYLECVTLDRPPLALALGPRGGGKSYLSALATHLDSIRAPLHGTRILGGSLSQSQQIYNALRDFQRVEPHRFRTFAKQHAEYTNGSDVSILAASSTSVRGPHIPTLRLDEIDEIDPEIREASLGMCMDKRGEPAAVSMTSTWHRIGGPMSDMLDQGRAGAFPTFTFCAFEVLERCPAERSGTHLEKCPACPLVRWCHDVPPGATPKAKRSNGHYGINALIQKTQAVSLRIFEADYLCLGPKADGLWFPRFDVGAHVTDRAEFDPLLETVLAVDIGVFTGAVLFQLDVADPPTCRVFADYLCEGESAEANARALLALAGERCCGRIHKAYADPAGNARNPVIDESVIEIYDRAGLPVDPWPIARVLDGLELIESFLSPAYGPPRLLIHPRCTRLINAFRSYRRAKRQGQWSERPEDPQHPHEDLMDALRGGLKAEMGGTNTWADDPNG